jgi:hypothetical protein
VVGQDARAVITVPVRNGIGRLAASSSPVRSHLVLRQGRGSSTGEVSCYAENSWHYEFK